MAQQVRALPPRTPAISNKSSRLTKNLPTCCKGVSAVLSSTIQSSIPRRPSVSPPRLLGQGRKKVGLCCRVCPTLPALCETARGHNWVDKHRDIVCDRSSRPLLAPEAYHRCLKSPTPRHLRRRLRASRRRSSMGHRVPKACPVGARARTIRAALGLSGLAQRPRRDHHSRRGRWRFRSTLDRT